MAPNEGSGWQGQPERLIERCQALEFVGRQAFEKTVDVCAEESVNLLLNGSRLASLTMTPADLEAFACGYLVGEGLIQGVGQIGRVDVRWPNVDVAVPALTIDDAGLWLEIRSSGCVGIRSAWEELTRPVRSQLSVDVQTIGDCMGLLNEQATLWRRTGGAHCAVICDGAGGIVSHAEDIGRHCAVDKAVGKALLAGRDLSECFLLSTGRQPAGMVAKAYRAGLPMVVSNTAPLSSGVEIARRLGMTLVCFARPPRMSVYSGEGRIRGFQRGG